MQEVREYAQSHVDVEDFKAITRSMEHKGKSSKKARKSVEDMIGGKSRLE